MNIIFLIGRILLGLFFIMMGMNHFSKRKMLTQYGASKGIKSPMLAVLVTGLLLLFGGIGLLFGIWMPWALIALVVFFVLVTPQMHNFWAIQDPKEKMVEKINFMKNIALLGAILALLWAAQYPWPYTL